jgi:hypothetical protein
LRHPHRVEPDAADRSLTHALVAIEEYGGRVLRVVYDAEAEPWRIVTVFFDRRERNRA